MAVGSNPTVGQIFFSLKGQTLFDGFPSMLSLRQPGQIWSGAWHDHGVYLVSGLACCARSEHRFFTNVLSGISVKSALKKVATVVTCRYMQPPERNRTMLLSWLGANVMDDISTYVQYMWHPFWIESRNMHATIGAQAVRAAIRNVCWHLRLACIATCMIPGCYRPGESAILSEKIHTTWIQVYDEAPRMGTTKTQFLSCARGP